MGRPKRDASAAEKQRAYRARLAAETVRVNRRAWAALEARRDRVAEAVWAARQAGCATAAQIVGASPDTVLEALSAWFEAHAAGSCACAAPVPPAATGAQRGRRQ